LCDIFIQIGQFFKELCKKTKGLLTFLQQMTRNFNAVFILIFVVENRSEAEENQSQYLDMTGELLRQ